jgi:hypothetical protein
MPHSWSSAQVPLSRNLSCFFKQGHSRKACQLFSNSDTIKPELHTLKIVMFGDNLKSIYGSPVKMASWIIPYVVVPRAMLGKVL